MIKVEGSTDGVKWVLFATTHSLLDARKSASKCIQHTKHTQVRITGALQ